MKQKNLRRICLALFAITGLMQAVIAGEDDMDPQYLGALIANPGSDVVVAVENAGLYAAPDLDSAPILHAHWTQTLQIDSRKLVLAPKGWIPLKALHDWQTNETGHKRMDFPSVWIRRADIALPQDFKKIVGCWPIKSFALVAGDYEVTFRFKPDGTATAKEWVDNDPTIKAPTHKVQLSIAKNLVIAQGKKAYFPMGYRPSDRTPYPEGIDSESLVRLSDAELKGCESGLRLAP